MYLQKVISRKTFFKLVYCCRREGLCQKKLDPDPLVRGMDPIRGSGSAPQCHGSARNTDIVTDATLNLYLDYL
jgi:hypothetical protein